MKSNVQLMASTLWYKPNWAYGPTLMAHCLITSQPLDQN